MSQTAVLEDISTPTPVAHAMPLSLRSNFSWTFMANVILAASQAGVLGILITLGTSEMTGLFYLGLTMVTPTLLFTDLSLRAVQATDSRQDYDFRDYFGLRLAMTTIAIPVIGIWAIIYCGGNVYEIGAILVIALSKGSESIADVIFGALQQRERMDRVAISVILRAIGSVVAVGIVFFITRELILAVAAMLAVRLLLLVYYDIPNASWLNGRSCENNEKKPNWLAIRPRFCLRTMRKLAWLSAPLALVSVLIALNATIPRLFLDSYHGKTSLAVFATLAYLIILGNVVVGALGRAVSPRLSQYFADGNHAAYWRMMWILVAIGAALGGGLVLFGAIAGKPILQWINPDRQYDVRIVTWVMIAGGIQFIASFLGVVATASRRFRHMTIPSILSTLFCLMVSAWLIPAHGILGASWVMCLISISLCAAPAAVLWRVWREQGQQTASI